MGADRIYDLAVVGAGPAGMMASITALRRGASVLLLEKNPQLGRKLLATGNGRCNICNRSADICHYHGAEQSFISAVISQFDPGQTVHFFEELGLLLKEEDYGRIFPRTNQAASVLSVLEWESGRLGADIITGCIVVSLVPGENWSIKTASGAVCRSRNLLISTGGRAAHQFGSSGEGLGWAHNLGHTIIPTYPALVPLESPDILTKKLQGLKIEASCSYTDTAGQVYKTFGDLHFTEYGISGPAAMSLARFMAPVLRNATAEVRIDLLPDIEAKKLSELLSSRADVPIIQVLTGILPGKLALEIPEAASIRPQARLSEEPAETLSKIISAIKDTKIIITKLRAFKHAQVTAGGVDTSQIDPQSLRSKLADNLYFAGEILDVDGDSGGFNLQWAWSSGYVAGLLQG